MEKVISRTAYCPKCADVQCPNGGELVAVYGRTSKGVLIISAKSGTSGMTPHFFFKEKVEKGKVYGIKCCGVDGCGVDLTPHKKDDLMNVKFVETEAFTMSERQWRALKNFTDNGYEV